MNIKTIWSDKWPVISCFFLFVINQILQKNHLSVSFTRNYFDDLLCMPVVLGFCLTMIQWIKRDPLYRLDWWHFAVTFIYITLVFEVIVPPNFTSDYWDILCYALGTLIFSFWMNR